MSLGYISLIPHQPGRLIQSEMANEGELPTSADKGKGKAEDVPELNGKKPQKDEKAPAEDKKKDGELPEGRS